jgi:hypothetical protein
MVDPTEAPDNCIAIAEPNKETCIGCAMLKQTGERFSCRNTGPSCVPSGRKDESFVIFKEVSKS